MSLHHLYRRQTLATTIDKAWEFFTQPENLKLITPAFMSFDIQSFSGPRSLHGGQIITYKVKPFFGIPFSWVTEVTHAEEPHFFVDEQRFGPFLFWHHKHYLEETPDGNVVMIDSVHYKVFYGFVGSLLDRLIVQQRLDLIFDYRTRVIAEMFGAAEERG
ncbi:SRPBCC family protein [Thioalkalicoccus limnaeus]|uniref:SRPBCC family protein n=1 Tax=Thioalkalicoccus limnaeus TaxID=120681 RepID=A0ABV4B932_9GAMM